MYNWWETFQLVLVFAIGTYMYGRVVIKNANFITFIAFSHSDVAKRKFRANEYVS